MNININKKDIDLVALLRDLWTDIIQAIDHNQIGDGPPWIITYGLCEALTGLANTITWHGGRKKIDAAIHGLKKQQQQTERR